MLANLHALTVSIEPEAVRENVYKMTALYLALGLDPAKSTIFVQSMVPAHTELTWLLNTIATMGEMRRMTQFKDKAGADQESVSVALFDYPVLMAADILLYQAEQVPVGEDQRQHIELARNLAERFNHRYGICFKIPVAITLGQGARIMGLDNPLKKMSKSLGPHNYISLLDPSPTIREKIQGAVTDSENTVRFDPANKPAISNLLLIFSAITDRSVPELEREYATTGYGRFKSGLADALDAVLLPIQAKYAPLIADRPALDAILMRGAAQAEVVAGATLKAVKSKMGIL